MNPELAGRAGKRQMQVPFFRVDLGAEEIEEVVSVLRSGWLTTGPRVERFEGEFARAVGARFGIALNSCTAALHLALEALGLREGQDVLIPTMTFAATAEVVRYMRATPILVDCEPVTMNMSLDDALSKLGARGPWGAAVSTAGAAAGVIPVHVGGLMMDMDEVAEFAREHGLWVVEDAAHAFPSSYRVSSGTPWRRCGEGTASVSCFSFYANKTITTGEGGMAATDSQKLADRIRLMSLHGLSKDAWARYSSGGSWDYSIVAPGFKYNMTDVAGAIGLHQLRRAEALRNSRERIANAYFAGLSKAEAVELPARDANRVHSWHLFPIRLRLDQLRLDRRRFIKEMRECGVSCSVHWRPLHLHPYYADLGWRQEDCPVATREWRRLVSLPLFPGMRQDEVEHVISAVNYLCRRYRR